MLLFLTVLSGMDGCSVLRAFESKRALSGLGHTAITRHRELRWQGVEAGRPRIGVRRAK